MGRNMSWVPKVGERVMALANMNNCVPVGAIGIVREVSIGGNIGLAECLFESEVVAGFSQRTFPMYFKELRPAETEFARWVGEVLDAHTEKG